jgi:hypothetical protein
VTKNNRVSNSGFILIFGLTILQKSIAQTKISCGIQLGGIVITQSDQQQYCLGSTDGQKVADSNFQHHAKFNGFPLPQSQDLNTQRLAMRVIEKATMMNETCSWKVNRYYCYKVSFIS